MKKPAAICLILLGAFSQTFAQKFDREWFTYQNTHIPSKLIYDQIKNYGVNVVVNNSNMYTMDYNFANSMAVSFASYDKVDYANANLKVSAVYGPCSFIEEKTSSTTREEEVNKQKVRVTYYKKICSFRFPINYRLVNGKNNATLFYNEFSSNNIRTVESPEFKSETEANNYMNGNRNKFVANHVNELCGQFMKNSNATIRDMFDFFPTQTNMEIFKFKKWEKDDEYNEHVKNVMNTFKAQTADEQPEVVKEKLKNDIAYFQSFEGVFKADDKKEDILYFCNYYNLAAIFFCLDDYEKARGYAAKLDASDKQEGSTRNLKNYIETASKRTSRHFLANTHLIYNPVKDYKLAGKNVVSDAASETENMAASLASGTIAANDKVVMSDNREIVGKIAFVKERNELQMVPKESPDKPVTLTPLNCLRFNIDTLNYLVAKNKDGGAPIKQFFLVHHNSDRIKLIQFVDQAFVPNTTYIGFIRPSEEFVTFATGFGVKKKLAGYFEDCGDVSKKAKDGDFGGAFSTNTLNNYKQLCKEYDSCR